MSMRVQPRDVWQVGPHLVACLDVTGDTLKVQRLITATAPVMAYVDAPYNASAYAYFARTALGSYYPSFHMFLGHLASTLLLVQGEVYVECGVQTVMQFTQVFTSLGFQVLDEWSITYQRVRPARLLHLLSPRAPAGLTLEGEPLDGLDDTVAPRVAIERSSEEGDWVLDCCLGLGLTLRSADACGRRCLGIEVHPDRLRRAIASLGSRYYPEAVIG